MQYSTASPGAENLPLGNTTEFAVEALEVDTKTGELVSSAIGSARRERYEIQRLAAAFTSQLHAAGERVTDRLTYCGRRAHGEFVSVLRDHSRKGRGLFGGLHVCANAWLCPICSSIIQNRRAEECREAIATAEARGYTARMITLTAPHTVGDDLSDLLASLTSAWRSMTSVTSWKRLKSRIGMLGFVRSFEMTYGNNGWHPHFHVIVFSRERPPVDTVYSCWESACHRNGLGTPSPQHGVIVSDGDDLGTYLNKMSEDSHLPDGTGITWDGADELAKAHTKRGKYSWTPFDILRAYARQGFTPQSMNQEARRLRGLWRVYALATRGRSSLQWSRGLKSALEVGEQTDAEVLETTEAQAEVFAVLTAVEFGRIRDARLQADALELAEFGTLREFARFVYSFARPGYSFERWFRYFQERLLNQGESVEYAQRADSAAFQQVMPVNADSASASASLNSALSPDLDRLDRQPRRYRLTTWVSPGSTSSARILSLRALPAKAPRPFRL